MTELSLAAKADKLKLVDTKYHLFLCVESENSRCCSLEESETSWNFLKKRLTELQLPFTIHRSRARCLRVCEGGPILVVYPDGVWYHSCTPEVIERILREHLSEGRIVEEFCFSQT